MAREKKLYISTNERRKRDIIQMFMVLLLQMV